MHRDYTKVCRVCLSNGSRDIFYKRMEGTESNTSSPLSPLDRLVEKFRYVTMMKVDEFDDLPRLLCDLCIVQLNVSYNFKKQAVENDTKLRQYFIENGISAHQQITVTESFRSTHTSLSAVPIHRNRTAILPFIVKTEPIDCDSFSETTTVTNSEVDVPNHLLLNEPSPIQDNSKETTNQQSNSTYGKDSTTSMVYVNGYCLNSLTPSSDIEFIQNYQMNTTNKDNTNSTTTTTTVQNSKEQTTTDTTYTRKPHTDVSHLREISENSQTMAKKQIKHLQKDGRNSLTNNKTKSKNISREMGNLSIDMTLPIGKRSRLDLKQKMKFKQTRERKQIISKPKSILIGTTTNKNTKNNVAQPLPPEPTLKTKSKIKNENKEIKKSTTTNKINDIEKNKNENNSQLKEEESIEIIDISTSASSTPKSERSNQGTKNKDNTKFNSSKNKKESSGKIFFNPFTAVINKKLKLSKAKKDGKIKKFSSQKLLRPKIEPPITPIRREKKY